MDQQIHRLQWNVCRLILAVILFIPAQAFAQDNKIVNGSGFSVQVFPLPQSLAGMPMRISFNGTSGASDAPEETPVSVSGFSSTKPQPPDDLNNQLSRFRTYLFQYLDVTGPTSAGIITDAFSAVPDSQTGSGEVPANDQGVSLKIQADVSEKSGALVFVIKI
jgi:hypothetical protein